MTAAETAAKLRAIADEIEQHPERWTTEVLARDAEGGGVAAQNPRAVCWCVYGLVERSHADIAPVYGALNLLYGHPAIAQWNDAPERTPADIVALFRRAADLAESAS